VITFDNLRNLASINDIFTSRFVESPRQSRIDRTKIFKFARRGKMDASHVHDGKKITSLLELPDEVCKKRTLRLSSFAYAKAKVRVPSHDAYCCTRVFAYRSFHQSLIFCRITDASILF